LFQLYRYVTIQAAKGKEKTHNEPVKKELVYGTGGTGRPCCVFPYRIYPYRIVAVTLVARGSRIFRLIPARIYFTQAAVWKLEIHACNNPSHFQPNKHIYIYIGLVPKDFFKTTISCKIWIKARTACDCHY
jgi:hypothetical protein